MVVGIVIPTLVRADMLKRALNSIVEHTEAADVRIINNWTHKGVAEVCATYHRMQLPNHGFHVENRPQNLGCAGAWNLGLKQLFERGCEWAIVMNDDAELCEGTVDALKDALDSGLSLAWSEVSFACFAIHKRAVDAVGWFDQNFWPAYHEDEDYMHRLRLAGLQSGPAENAKAKHQGSSTLAYSDLLWFRHRMRLDQKNLIYYGRKWGGVPNYERFASPFNDGKSALSYWPDPKPEKLGLVLDEHDKVVLENDGSLSIRVYGPTMGNGSVARVTRGIVEAARDLCIHAGTVDMDAFDSQEIHEAPGRNATLGIYVGNPTYVSATMAGGHDMVFSILAPNSSWLPERMLQNLRDRSTVIAPSSWGAEVLANHGCQRMPPLRHGVSSAFKLSNESQSFTDELYQKGSFRVLHLSSSDRERKGTRELLLAWKSLVAEKKLGDDPLLVAFVDAPEGFFAEAKDDPTIRLTNQRIDASEADMAFVYQAFHIVCQPSRGEGFGMVPLEARACGVPVVATACTGHADHMLADQPGCVIVRSGEDAPIDDGPGALAPSVKAEDIADALQSAYCNWRALSSEARAFAPTVASEWSWSNQTKAWLLNMGLWRNK